jgi:hypothetical protein
VIYIITNASVIILSWFPVDEQKALKTTRPTLPYFTGPVTALAVMAFGVLWWCWDRHILRKLGYVWSIEEKVEDSVEWGIPTLRLKITVSRSSPSHLCVLGFYVV